MVQRLRLPRGNTEWNDRQLREPGVITLDTALKQIRMHDGIQPGGHVIGTSSSGDSTIFESGLRILGKLDSIEDLPDITEFTDGDTFVITGSFYVAVGEQWVDIGDLRGPAGLSTFDIAVANGFIGNQEDWLESIRGSDGIGLKVIGTRLAVEDLPTIGENNGDSYVVNTRMYTWVNDSWEEIGSVGPPGRSAYQVAIDAGDISPDTTRLQWLEMQKGRNAFQLARDYEQIPLSWNMEDYLEWLKGKDAYDLAKAAGFEGTESEWLISQTGPEGPKGDKGDQGDQGEPAHAIKVIGGVSEVADLPTENNLPGDAYYHLLDLHVWTGESWTNLGEVVGPPGQQGTKGDKGDKGDTGDKGLSAYQVAIEERVFSGNAREWLDFINGLSAFEVARRNDFSGSITTEEAWLESLVGKNSYEVMLERGEVTDYDDWVTKMRGPRGDTGPRGDVGRGLLITGYLSSVGNLPGEASEGDTYVIDGHAWIYLSGTWQDLGPFRGPKGDKGDKGDPGLVGPMGTGLKILDYFTSTSQLPDNAEHQDAYMVNERLWIFLTNAWVDVGGVRGPEGPRGNAGPKGDQGERGPQGQKGERGNQGVKGDRGDRGNDGPEGPRGPAGSGVKILGVYGSPGELPSTNNETGDGYLVSSDLWIWSADGNWENAGPVRGPKGDQGNQGIKGDRGEEGKIGVRGPRGSVWLHFARDPSPIDGVSGDYAVNTLTNYYFVKRDGLTWDLLGNLGSGTVEEAPHDDFEYVRVNGAWVRVTVELEDAPDDGLVYSRKHGEWVRVKENTLPPKDGKKYLMQDEAWVEPDVKEAPNDGHPYIRRGRGWERNGRSWVKSTYTDGQLFIDEEQAFRILLDRNRTITFNSELPEDWAFTIVITLEDKVGTVTWPSEIIWENGVVPNGDVLGSNHTVVTLYWNGAVLLGSVSMVF